MLLQRPTNTVWLQQLGESINTQNRGSEATRLLEMTFDNEAQEHHPVLFSPVKPRGSEACRTSFSSINSK